VKEIQGDTAFKVLRRRNGYEDRSWCRKIFWQENTNPVY